MNSAQSNQITSTDLDKLRNMLGVGQDRPRRVWGYRNYYVAGKGSEPAMRRLESAGLVREIFSCGDTTYFRATEEGCKAVGMNDAQVKRAMED